MTAIRLVQGPARAALAEGIGLALSGVRATVAVSGAGLCAALDQLAAAVARRAALVVRLDLAGDDHAAYHAAGDVGAATLFAAGAADADLLELVARRVAETALLPVVVARDDGGEPAPTSPERAAAARRYLGLPDDLVPVPTPVQALLFGARRRRRLPRWHDPNRPVLLGGPVSPDLRDRARVAAAEYLDGAVAPALEQAWAALSEAGLPARAAVTAHGAARAPTVLLVQGGAAAVAARVAAARKDLLVVELASLRPGDPARLMELLRGRTRAVVLERAPSAVAEPPLLGEVRALLDRAGEADRHRARPRTLVHGVSFGLGGGALREDDLAELCRRLAADELPPRAYLGVEFAPPPSPAHPRRQVLLEQLHRARPDLAPRGVAAPRASAPAPPDAVPPRVVREHARFRDHFANLPRFWDQQAAPVRAGDAQPVADPYLGLGAVPALSAVFDPAPAREALARVAHADRCTGCGRCWTVCPDTAIAPAVLPAAALLEAGMAMARERGGSGEALRAVVRKLATGVERALAQQPPPADAGAAVAAAWQAMRGALPAERQGELDPAAAAVAGALEGLPLARPAAFGAGGDLLALAVDPTACKGCGLCVAECEPQVLESAARDGAAVAAAGAALAQWEALPDVAGATVARLLESEVPGPAAASLLPRSCMHALARGGASEPGSGARIALRLALAAVESVQQPRLQAKLAQAEQLQGQVADAIRTLLADALPTGDLDALAAGVDLLGRGDFELSEWAQRMEQVCAGGHVDTRRLGELVELARGLADLRWRWRVGGNGRARAGLVVVGDALARELAGYPWNPFAVPTVVATDGEQALALAAGIAAGQRDDALRDVRLLRAARAAVQGAAEAARTAAALPRLAFADLDRDERAIASPVLVAAPAEQLAGASGAGLSAVLHGDAALKLVALVDADPLAPPAAADLALAAACAAGARARVAQGSLGAIDELARELRAAMVHDGAALLCVHAPSPRRDGFAPDRTVARARAAAAARALPLFRYDPAAPGVFGTRIALSPPPPADGDGAVARWLAGERRVAGHLRPPTSARPVPVDDFLALPPEQRAGSVAVLATDGGTVELAPELAAALGEQRRRWQMVQELAGAVTPFTAAVREQAERAVAERHADELAAAERRGEQRLAELRAQVEGEMLQRLRQRLVTLSLEGRR